MSADLLSPDEVAALIGHGVTAYTVAQARRDGQIVGIRLGRRWLYALTDVHAWIDSNRTLRTTTSRTVSPLSDRSARARDRTA